MTKPEDWDEIHPTRKLGIAYRLLYSNKGNWVISKALHYAINLLKKKNKDDEDIGDMEILKDEIFKSFKEEENE